MDLLRGKLRTRHVQVFSEVTPEPDEATIRRGVALLERVQPDVLIAVGGGSVLDAGKAMRLFYEHPEKTLDELTHAVPRPAQAGGRLPDRPAPPPIGRDPNDFRVPARRCRRRRC